MADLIPKALVVEDDILSGFVARKCFEWIGFEVDLVDSAAKALERFKTGTYDLIVTDLTMPLMDGYQLAMELRGLGYKGVVIAVSGQGPEVLNATKATGIDYLMTKPFLRETMKTVVEGYASQGRLRMPGKD